MLFMALADFLLTNFLFLLSKLRFLLEFLFEKDSNDF